MTLQQITQRRSADETNRFRQIYIENAPCMVNFAQKFVSSFLAEDIVHDVFLKFKEKDLLVMRDSELKRLLFVSVRNACIDVLRRMKKSDKSIDGRSIQLKLDELDFFESSEELFMRKDLLEILRSKVEELPDKTKQIFKMSYIEGQKASEIAQSLDISQRTVENLLYRALRFLKKECSDITCLLFFF